MHICSMEPTAAAACGTTDANSTEGTMVDFSIQPSPDSDASNSKAQVSNAESLSEPVKAPENSQTDGAPSSETGTLELLPEEEPSKKEIESVGPDDTSKPEVRVEEGDTDREEKSGLAETDEEMSHSAEPDRALDNLVDKSDSVGGESKATTAGKEEGVVLHHGEALHGETEVDWLHSGVSLSIQDSAENPDDLSDSGSAHAREDSSESTLQSSSLSPSMLNHLQRQAQQTDSEISSSSKLTDGDSGRAVDEETSNHTEIQEIGSDTHLASPGAPLNEGGDAPESADPNNAKNHNDFSENHSHSTGPFSSLVNVSQLVSNIGDSRGGGEQSCNAQENVLRAVVRGGQADVRSAKQLKKLLRSCSWGPAANVRKAAWHLVCGHLYKLEKPYVYTQMEKEMFGDSEGEEVPVPSWPQQTAHHEELLLTENYLNARGKNTAHKIMSVIIQLSPDISYCPGLLPLVDLFLHYLDAADTFSCIFTLLHSTSCVYFTQTRMAFEASKRVIRDLVKTYAKSAYVSLVRNSTNIDAVFDNWLGWIYTDLPFEYVVTITDSYLMEGIKVLYRVVLALLILYNKRSGPGNRGGNPAQSISQFCQKPPVTPARLMKIAFKIRGFSRNKMMKLQKRHEGHHSSNGASSRPAVPRVSSSQSFGSAAVSTAVSVTQATTKMMGLHDTGSNILSVDQLAAIWSWLPQRYSIRQPILLFNSEVLGTSLTTLYSKIEFEPCTIIIIKAITQEVFGAFCAESWLERRTHSRPIRFFGTGETFVFTLVPDRAKFEWVGKPDPHVPHSANMFQAGDHASLLIGGGSGSAIQLDGMMERCRTETCDTFNNPPLCPSMDFTPAAIEVFGLS